MPVQILPTPNQEEILQFQTLYEQLNDKPISLKDAQAMLTDLVQFYYLVGGHEVRRSHGDKGTTDHQS